MQDHLFELHAKIKLGTRLLIGDHKCTVKYIGQVGEKQGEWYGVEWDDPARGKNDGLGLFKTALSLAGSFLKLNKTENGSFISGKRPVFTGIEFLKAVREKYISEAPASHVQLGNSNGVIVETFGWDKMQRKLAQIDLLRELGLSDMRISFGVDTDEIAKSLPLVEDIDLSRNLLSSLEVVADICWKLQNLKILRLNYCRFTSPFEIRSKDKYLSQVQILTLVSTLLSWSDIMLISESFPNLKELHIGHNRISCLHGLPTFNSLKVLDLEYNNFQSWKDIESLEIMQSLSNLNLANNSINSIVFNPNSFQQLKTLNLSNNAVDSWLDVHQLNKFPALVNIRLAGNPIVKPIDEERIHVFLIGRLAKATRINGSHVSSSTRRDAECYYLSRAHLDRELSNFKVLHPLYEDLCAIHGTPTSKKEDKTIADGLLELNFTKKNGENSVVKKLSKKTTIRMVRTVLARSLWPKTWHSAARGNLILLKNEIVEELIGDDKTLEYFEIGSGATLSIEY